MKRALIAAALALSTLGCASTKSYNYPSPDGRWIAVVETSNIGQDTEVRVHATDTVADRSYVDILQARNAAPIGVDWRSGQEVRIYLCNATNVELTDASADELPMLGVTFETAFDDFCLDGNGAQAVPQE
ncbi:hypothetical protein AAG596_03960 [Citromicrobium bathyomarinum]|uniref:hypothetical protein n=1 Tax=Citromicrobium bathyomarinum TaxID=72174 RepID=UPI003159BCE4